MTVKVIAFTEFRKNASRLITNVGAGDSLVIFRHGKPVARVLPYAEESDEMPAWKQPGIRLDIPGVEISSAILQERAESW